METDYSRQFRFIRQHEVEDIKYLNVSISSTYGCALLLKRNYWRNNGDVHQYNGYENVWTDVFESRKYEDPEDFSEICTNIIEYNDGNKGKRYMIKHNCDGRVVAMTVKLSKIVFFDAAVVAPNADREHEIRPIHGFKLTNSSVKNLSRINMLEWNPKNPAMFVVTLAKTLFTILFDFEEESSRILAKRDMFDIMTAVSWNPNGTQLIVGDDDGRIFQFTPQLKLIRIVNPPNLTPSVFSDKFACSGICWVSKTDRVVVFTSETSDKLHLTKLTVKPNKRSKWTVWDVLPAVENNRCRKSFNFLPVFGWDTVLMSSPCLSEVYTFGVVNNAWQPLKLDECFTIKAPIEQIIKPIEKKKKKSPSCHHREKEEPTRETYPPTASDLCKLKKAFITSMSINYSSQQSNIMGKWQALSPQPVIYVTTSNGALYVYQMISHCSSDRPSFVKPAETIEKTKARNGPHEDGYNLDNKSSTDSDASTSYSHSCSDWEAEKATWTHRRQKKGTNTISYKKDAEAQTNFNRGSSAIMKLRKEIIRLREIDIGAKKDLANFTRLRLHEAGKLSAYGVLEVYAAENEIFNQIRDIKERWLAMYHGDAKLIAEIKRLHCNLSADEFVAAVLSILSKPVARIMNLDADGLTVKGSDFFRVENTVLEVVCGVMFVKFTIV